MVCFLVSILEEVYLRLLFLFCLLCDVINRIYFLQSQKEQYEKHHNTADGRIRIWFGLRQIMNATDRLLLETRDVAQKLNTGIHMVLTQSLLVYWSLSTLNNALLRLVHAYMIEEFMHNPTWAWAVFNLGMLMIWASQVLLQLRQMSYIKFNTTFLYCCIEKNVLNYWSQSNPISLELEDSVIVADWIAAPRNLQ